MSLIKNEPVGNNFVHKHIPQYSTDINNEVGLTPLIHYFSQAASPTNISVNAYKICLPDFKWIF